MRHDDASSRERARSTKGTVLALLGVFAFALAISCGRHPSRPFDAERWREEYNRNEESTVRFEMLDDLCTTHLRPGVSRQAVVRLLGEPDLERWSDRRPFPGWVLGLDRSGGYLDLVGLQIEFSKDGRVVRVHR